MSRSNYEKRHFYTILQTMPTLIILCHPASESFCHSILHALQVSAKEAGNDCQVIDLYREGFDPTLSLEELRRKLSFDPLVQRYSHMLLQTTRLCIVHPDWWGAPPALLKGWIDRVLRSEVAYRHIDESSETEGLLGKLHLLVAISSDGEEGGSSCRALQTMWEHVANFCGIASCTIMIMHRIQNSSLHQRRDFLQRVTAQLPRMER